MEFKTTKPVLLPSLSDPQRAQGEISQKVSGSKRAPASSGDFWRHTLARRVIPH
ncbi:hypothetical protein A2U01_0083671 [Trifolium medium]|uniref:Uncharacterized protein n=1 Tax=Trifolium medium TaxID=97028 RepID=A0A392TP51_9FABA|nr:hypothetical protein [Trifolium medium]